MYTVNLQISCEDHVSKVVGISPIHIHTLFNIHDVKPVLKTT